MNIEKRNESVVAGKTYSEILSMTNQQRYLWYKTILLEEKEEVMEFVRIIRGIEHSIRMIGKNNPMYGKMSGENNPAKRPEVRTKMSESKMGAKHPMYGKLCPEHSERMRGENNPMYGKERTEEWRRRHSECMSGENHWNFNNWASREPYCQNWTEEVREHIRNLYNRTCTICEKSVLQYFRMGSKMWSRLHVDHTDENKMQGCDDWEWRLNPLCPSCHSKMQKQKISWHLLLQVLLLNNKKHQTNFLFGDEL